MSLQYKKFEKEDGWASVVLFHDGELYSATSDHPNWEQIDAGLKNDDASVVDWFDISKQVEKKFAELSERVRVANGQVLFDGDVVDTVLTRQIVRFLDEGQDFAPLVSFYERLAQNPNQESVDQLYRWLDSHKFTITEDGKIIGYKGVQRNDQGTFESVKRGRALVNGVEFNGNIPNNAGDVVEMPRSDVTFDPSESCSTGLHIGTWDYARGWASNGAVLKVLVDPRDVVSVPTDSGGQKLRACRYKVLEVIEQEVSDSVVVAEGWWGDGWDDEYEDDDAYDDEECGCAACECDDDNQYGYTSVLDVTKAEDVTSKVVDSSLSWPDFCGTCNGPCTL